MDETMVTFSSGGVLANTAAVISAACSAPFTDSIIKIIPNVEGDTHPEQKGNKADSIIGTPTQFKMVLLATVILTVAFAAVQIIIAIYFPHTTANEQSVFQDMGSAWKASLGAHLGLLGGKALE